MKYEYLYNSENVLTHHSVAIRGDEYRLYPELPLDFVFKEGDERQFFSLKIENPFLDISICGESVEHYNVKMKIVHEKKYYDTVFKQDVFFDEVIAEKWHDVKKRPDLSCYNNGKLVFCIEIFNSNNKKSEDINKLKELDCLIVEININNENRCEHIALPKVFEIHKREYFILKEQYSELADNLQVGLSKTPGRIKKINNWLQRRLPKGISKQYRDGDAIQSIANIETEIITTEREVARIENANQKYDYGTGKIENRITEVRNEIRSAENAFNEIADKSKIEWFRNSWMIFEVQNKISEIKYWLS